MVRWEQHFHVLAPANVESNVAGRIQQLVRAGGTRIKRWESREWICPAPGHGDSWVRRPCRGEGQYTSCGTQRGFQGR